MIPWQMISMILFLLVDIPIAPSSEGWIARSSAWTSRNATPLEPSPRTLSGDLGTWGWMIQEDVTNNNMDFKQLNICNIGKPGGKLVVQTLLALPYPQADVIGRGSAIHEFGFFTNFKPKISG